VSDAPTCDMPECSTTEGLAPCRDLQDNPMQVCEGCRADWSTQLRVLEAQP